MIKVCPNCSGVDVEELKKSVGEENLYLGCIGLCGQNTGKSFGYINDQLVIKDSSEEFIEAVKIAN
ncbi:hypothetical protein CSC2_13120 [Clostridium zeae]|uniref:DUF1450 domain-containing protein n=1 Tax=Clostridium zeae TaxID=2759022 RepID=A0ABQ1E7Y5_9CLOT|nr:DUF1450 domain-containing protein [Clostridium zeae]GFZ30786.1 hypothetical protein CSC2_13120 [Clostridium zeae]